jgi:hypothetical protein
MKLFWVAVAILITFEIATLTVILNHQDNTGRMLTFYGTDDIYYVDIDKLRVGTESGRIDTSFDTFQDMAAFIDQVSADVENRAMTYEITAALKGTSATVMDGGNAVLLKLYNYHERDTIGVVLSKTDNGSFIFQD